MSRCFVVTKSNIGKTGGAYHSESPEQAAKKAGRQLLLHSSRSASSPKRKSSPKRSPGRKSPGRKAVSHVKFSIAEHFGGRSYGEERSYTTRRVTKKKPTVFVVGGREIVSKYDYTTTRE